MAPKRQVNQIALRDNLWSSEGHFQRPIWATTDVFSIFKGNRLDQHRVMGTIDPAYLDFVEPKINQPTMFQYQAEQ